VVWENKCSVTLRCFACSARFTVADVAFEQVSGLAHVVPCPACGARPLASAGPHKVVALAREPQEQDERVKIELRLGPEMYRRLAARALPGSRAAAYLKNSAWCDGAYLLTVDSEALTALAALAEGSSCPEAIRAMRAAYLSAIGAE
jgi:hypothetical protein